MYGTFMNITYNDCTLTIFIVVQNLRLNLITELVTMLASTERKCVKYSTADQKNDTICNMKNM